MIRILFSVENSGIFELCFLCGNTVSLVIIYSLWHLSPNGHWPVITSVLPASITFPHFLAIRAKNIGCRYLPRWSPPNFHIFTFMKILSQGRDFSTPFCGFIRANESSGRNYGIFKSYTVVTQCFQALKHSPTLYLPHPWTITRSVRVAEEDHDWARMRTWRPVIVM